MNSKQIFLAAFALISDPAHWTKGAHARNALDKSVDVYDTTACKFCSAGAIYRVMRLNLPERSNVLTALNEQVRRMYDAQIITQVNDRFPHAQVLDVWRKAGEAQGWI